MMPGCGSGLGDLVNGDDRLVCGNKLKRTYFGEANLGLEFNSGDLTQVSTAGEHETGEAAGWGSGDWDGDGFFNSNDTVTALADGGHDKGDRWLLSSLSVAGLPDNVA